MRLVFENGVHRLMGGGYIGMNPNEYTFSSLEKPSEEFPYFLQHHFETEDYLYLKVLSDGRVTESKLYVITVDKKTGFMKKELCIQ